MWKWQPLPVKWYLAERRSVIESARALFIHPNTLRQRLARIEELTGLRLDEDDLLSLELAIKLARSHGWPGRSGGARSRAGAVTARFTARGRPRTPKNPLNLPNPIRTTAFGKTSVDIQCSTSQTPNPPPDLAC
jgi:PucR C-terminal helix-turn-helix domain